MTILRSNLKKKEHWEGVGRPCFMPCPNVFTTRSLGFLFYTLKRLDYMISKYPYIAAVQRISEMKQCSPSPRLYPVAIKWSSTLVTSHLCLYLENGPHWCRLGYKIPGDKLSRSNYSCYPGVQLQFMAITYD